MDSSVGGKVRWLILIYHLPREPSRHRVAVWRRLKALGALYLQDGAAALPEDAVTREQLEWLQVRVREAAYRGLIDAAGGLRQKAALGAGRTVLLDELARIERDFRNERRRDYFRSPLRKVADAAIREARRIVKNRSVREDAG